MRASPILSAAAIALALGLGAPLAVPAHAATTGSMAIAAKGAAGTTVAGSNQFSVTGDTAVAMSVAHLSGGNAVLTAGPGGALPTAVKFPAYVASGTYPRAVVKVAPTSGVALSPGTADFQYGAVFRLDAASQGRTVDNGNNAFQRGLSSDPHMFKLEVDGGHPACTVRGTSGKVVVRSNVSVTPGAWYSATCSRVAGTLSVTVAPYATSIASSTTRTSSASGSTGDVTFTSGITASIGGKLYDSGAIDSSASDQFNGAIAEVWIKRT